MKSVVPILAILVMLAIVGGVIFLRAGSGLPPGTVVAGAPVVRPTAKVALISTGRVVDLAAYAEPVGDTIFEYTADW